MNNQPAHNPPNAADEAEPVDPIEHENGPAHPIEPPAVHNPAHAVNNPGAQAQQNVLPDVPGQNPSPLKRSLYGIPLGGN
ncbi:hypothetical protein FRC11_011484 [Ceratobasidium sp. 423]|nr:hypothetical protein FRC11_011484 [Ceratobasidium sp. 423]